MPSALILSLCLFVSCTTLVDGFRAKTEKRLATDGAEADGWRSLWCNPFSAKRTRYYHFDVRIAGEDCKTGNCMALRLIRNMSDPILEIHYGESWVVKKKDGTDDQLVWKLVQMNPKIPVKHQVITLHHVHEVTFKAADEKYGSGLPDTLSIKWGDDGQLDIKGGIYYNDDLILHGFEKIAENNTNTTAEEDYIGEMHADDVDDVARDGARDDQLLVHGGKWGNRIGAGAGGVTVAGFATAAFVTGAGASLTGTGLITGAMAGVLVGSAAGGIIGLAIAGGVGLAGLAGWVTLVHDHGLSATQKLWDKFWCLEGIRTCYKNELIDWQEQSLIMPKTKECREVLFHDNCERVEGAQSRDSMPFPNCKCSNDEEVYCKGIHMAGRKFHWDNISSMGPCSCSKGCEAIAGATFRNSAEYPGCKCNDYDHEVYCRGEKAADRKFDYQTVSLKGSCACGTGPSCEDIVGAVARRGEEYPDCKCLDYAEKIMCGDEVVGDRKFNASEIFAKPDCIPHCG